MIVAVPTHTHTSAGARWGHIAIYIGNGMVMDNIGYIRTTSLAWWLNYYHTTAIPQWGWDFKYAFGMMRILASMRNQRLLVYRITNAS